MAQYDILDSGGPAEIIVADETNQFRAQVRGDELFYEQAVTGVDSWTTIESVALPGSNEETFRLGARDTNWVEDQAKTGLGFGGSTPGDWENITESSL